MPQLTAMLAPLSLGCTTVLCLHGGGGGGGAHAQERDGGFQWDKDGGKRPC